MEQNRLSLRDVGDEARVGATLAVAHLESSTASVASYEMREPPRSRPEGAPGRHKGVPYIRPNSAHRTTFVADIA